MENAKIKKNNGKTILTIIVISILSVALVTLVVLYSISMSNQNNLKTDLENVYQKNFSELVDNVNNVEVKLSKVCASDYNSYAKKLLNEISKNSSMASTNLASLPVSIHGIDETIKFINQVGGYTEVMASKLEKGETLSNEEISTLEKLRDSFSMLKTKINELSKNIYSNNIFNQSTKLDGDYNEFTLKLQNIKAGDVEYPTMIYDGPFSDSTVNKKIKNLNDEKVDKETAKQKLVDIFKNISKSSCSYLGETNGKFKTYDFELFGNGNQTIYVQVSQNGAHLLTMSCSDNSSKQNYTLKQAKDIAISFAEQNGLGNMECVWSDIIGGDAYINLAPIQNGVIIYPDLIKVKVDLALGNVIGYESTTYFTNHIQRKLDIPKITSTTARTKVPNGYEIIETRLCLAPLDYNREVLCYENICVKNDETYYFYVNAQTNQIENILKIVETDNGNLLL